jgi:uncharacterized protein
MEFDFDPSKSEKNLRERGYDFAFAARVFLGRTVEFQDVRRNYGEVRMIAIGDIDGRVYKVVYTDRGDVRWIISSNPASRQEKRRWQG